jgi:hypothetical protein
MQFIDTLFKFIDLLLKIGVIALVVCHNAANYNACRAMPMRPRFASFRVYDHSIPP